MESEPGGVAGRRIVITGAGRDTGRAMAIVLSRLGARVVATARHMADARQTVALGAPGMEAVEIDLGITDSILAGCRSILDGGPVDALINNGSFWLEGSLEAVSVEGIVEAVNSTLTGTILMVRQLLAGLRRAPAPDVVSIISTAGLPGAVRTTGAAAFHAAKAGQAGFIEAVRQEFRREGIRFSAIYPPDFDPIDPSAPDWSTRAGDKLLSRDVVDAVLFALTRPRTVGFISIALDSFGALPTKVGN